MGFSFDLDFKIIFDDGYESIYKIAFPFMQKYGFTGLVFPVVSYIGRMNDWGVTFGSIIKAIHLNSTEIKSLVDEGWEIGSHGLTHTAITALSNKELKFELHEAGFRRYYLTRSRLYNTTIFTMD